LLRPLICIVSFGVFARSLPEAGNGGGDCACAAEYAA